MGYIYLYTGTGGGKTANALGLALRSVGHKRRVVIIQFLKWWKNTGEYKVRKKLEPYYEIHPFGRKGWIGLDNLTDEDKKLCKRGLRFARKAVLTKKVQLLVLDEVNLAVHCNMLQVEDVLEFLDAVPKETDVVITGRYAPKELVNRADFVIEVKDLKHPKESVTTKGIQY
ncbi:MAG: cob(I)yrinic acid a,c-diamide adenosyltransferase [Candidatus Bathyarchaeia archaeon]